MSRGCEEGVKSCEEGVKSCQESAKWTPSTCQEGVKRVSRECQGHAKRVSPRCQEGAKKVSQKAEALAAAAASGPGRLGQSDSDIEANFNTLSELTENLNRVLQEQVNLSRSCAEMSADRYKQT